MKNLRKIDAAGWLCAGLVLAIGWFYFWTAVPHWQEGLVGRHLAGYYNLLTRGFMKGHVYLDAKADPYLATLPDPWDPLQRGDHGMHDASYYRGHYYIYFGVAPVILLFLPFRLLTGEFIDERLASPVFACVGLVLAVGLLLAVRRRYFPRVPLMLIAACVLALGLGDMTAVLLRRPSVWEVPIACGYACCMAALAALFLSLHGRRRALWIALAGAAFGAAVASRPTYLFACPAILLPLWLEARERGLGRAWWRDPAWRRSALAAIAPLLAVGSGLALYNYLRFGNPLNFGFHYVMAGAEDTSKERIFSWHFLLYNLRVYLFAPARWTEYFPFVAVAKLPAPPPGYLGVEDPYGILPDMPFCLLALGTLLFAGRRGRAWGRLPVFCAAVAVTAAGAGLAVSCFGGACNRYMVDFAPALMLLASLGLLALAAQPWIRGAAARFAGGAACLLALYSAAFGAFASMRHNELFRAEHPALYSRVAYRWNWFSYGLDRLRKTQYGPIEMTVQFPQGRTDTIEPLVVTGESFLSDYLFVHYLGPDSLQFGLEHTSRGTLLGDPIRLDYGRPHTLRIDLGTLYPSADHAYFDRYSSDEARFLKRLVRVTVDGRVALDAEHDLYDPISPHPSIGTSGDRPGFTRPFSGRILSWRRLPDASVAVQPVLIGPLSLKLVLPPFTGIRCEPLICTGVTGRGDLLYVRYDSADRISFGYDHWGVGGMITGPLPVDPAATQIVEIDAGSLYPARSAGSAGVARLLVRLNGQTALDQPAPYYGCDPRTIAVGRNPIQASTAVPSFSGRLVGVKCYWP